MPIWNPWHGCHKLSPGCQNCYVYRRDAEYAKDSSIVTKTAAFNLPLKRNRAGEYKLSSGETIYTCFTSDFFLEDASKAMSLVTPRMCWRRGACKGLFMVAAAHSSISACFAVRAWRYCSIKWMLPIQPYVGCSH